MSVPGYQQQLKFMHKDGSYSAFGEADDAGSTWLSAFVFKTLQQALDFTFIDRKQIQIKTWEFLINQQGADGCFFGNNLLRFPYTILLTYFIIVCHLKKQNILNPK